MSASANRDGFLFDPGLGPWESGARSDLSEERRLERQALLAALADSELGRTEQKVTYILQRFPDARDSDTALAVRYWNHFEAEIVAQWDPLRLEVLHELTHFETLSRLRRHIQNDLDLFVSTARTRGLRDEMQLKLHQYLAERRDDDPEIRFYLDETGNSSEGLYTGVAGICVIDWRHYEMQHAALARWRERQPWLETLHFTRTTDGAALATALDLLRQLRNRRAGLLFVGHDVLARQAGPMTIISLFVQLISGAIEDLLRQNVLPPRCAVRVIKESDVGFDETRLPALREDLEQQLARTAGDRVYVRDVVPVAKGREVLLECADLIAGAMQRRARFNKQNPTDRLADAVMNVTGFEDLLREPGAWYRSFAHGPRHGAGPARA